MLSSVSDRTYRKQADALGPRPHEHLPPRRGATRVPGVVSPLPEGPKPRLPSLGPLIGLSHCLPGSTLLRRSSQKTSPSLFPKGKTETMTDKQCMVSAPTTRRRYLIP